MDILERYVAIDNKCAWPNLTLMPDGSKTDWEAAGSTTAAYSPRGRAFRGVPRCSMIFRGVP